MKGIIFGSTFDIAKEQLKILIKEYWKYWGLEPYRIISSRNEFKVIFENNDIWQAVKCFDGARGRSCNIAIIDKKISIEMIDTIIRPCLRKPIAAVSYFN